jgi:cysteine desulfurase family protein
MKEIIYFDNAATSWPKPKKVIEAIRHYLEEVGGSPGRSGHRMSILASKLVEDTRESVSKIFNFYDTSRIIFTKNVTEALNIILFSLLQSGDHVITSSVEHNSVMRPLRYLEKNGVSVSMVDCYADCTLDPGEVLKKIKKNTKLVVLTHANNVTGTIIPINKIASITSEKNIPLLIDCAQTAGSIPIEINSQQFENCILAFTGHKSLFGPTGTGGMCIGKNIKISPLIFGGTGSRSDKDTQPTFLPDMLESGTINILGLVGLKAGIDFILDKGVSKIRKYEKKLVERFIKKIIEMDTIKVYGTKSSETQVGIVSFNINNITPSKVGLILDHKYAIMSRIGLHCNPNAHKIIRTFPDGTVRFGFSYFNKMEQIEKTILALKDLSYNKKFI